MNSRPVQSSLFAIALLVVAVAITMLLLDRATTRVPRTQSAAPSLEVLRTNLVLTDGRLRLIGSTNSFTGNMVEHYVDGALRSRSAVSDGLLHGLSQGWFRNGQLQVSETFNRGVSHGLRTKWFPSGAKQSEASIVDGKLHGTFRKWHENGTLSEQVEFVAGRANGVSYAYFSSGYLKSQVTMRSGKPAEQSFWKEVEGHE